MSAEINKIVKILDSESKIDLDQLTQEVQKFLLHTKRSFSIPFNSFYIRQFDENKIKKMSEDDFKSIIQVFNLSPVRKSVLVDLFNRRQINELPQPVFEKELRKVINQTDLVRNHLKDLIFSKVYIQELERLSSYFRGNEKEDLLKIISTLQNNPREGEILSIDFLLKYYYKRRTLKLKNPIAPQTRLDVEDSYLQEHKYEILRTFR